MMTTDEKREVLQTVLRKMDECALMLCGLMVCDPGDRRIAAIPAPFDTGCGTARTHVVAMIRSLRGDEDGE
jgi:hypothetical protein